MMSLCRKRLTNGGGRGLHRLSKKRIMRTTGHNIVSVGVEDKHQKYISDLYTTLIDIQWRWNILIFVSGFVITWLLFACFYYAMGYLHGDFEETSTTTPCVENVQSFTAAYLFSIETMTTIGYGYRSQTEECPGVYLVVMLQSILGAGLQFALASLVVSKTRRSKRRSETILFSSKVCIYEFDSKLKMVIRVGDMTQGQIAGAHATGYLVKKYFSTDGTYVPVRSYSVTFTSECGRDEIFMPWPALVIHEINEESPLWSLSRDELLKGKFELIVVLDGVSMSTSTPFQARKSYHTNEMMWGYRFADLDMNFNKAGHYDMNISTFHDTIPASTPLCSAQDITNLRDMYKANHPEEETNKAGEASSRQGQTTAHTTDASSSGCKALCSRRAHSLDETARDQAGQKKRRFSLGDLIRSAQGTDQSSGNFLGDARNIYRHRLSVTDTYLGHNIVEEADEHEENDEAVRTIISQRSKDRSHPDVRDVFKRRKSSVTQLFFGPESSSSSEAEHEDPVTAEEILESSPNEGCKFESVA